MEDTIQLPRVVYAQLQATIMAQAQRIEEFDRAAATLKRDARRARREAVSRGSLDSHAESGESGEARETRDAETITHHRVLANADKRVLLGKQPRVCCAAQCEAETEERGELVSLPFCRHMMHVDCIIMLRGAGCPHCRRPICRSAEAREQRRADHEIISREARRAEAMARMWAPFVAAGAPAGAEWVAAPGAAPGAADDSAPINPRV